ncbi:MAG: TlpA family protein disulfide reductase [Bacteroidales bacterium]
MKNLFLITLLVSSFVACKSPEHELALGDQMPAFTIGDELSSEQLKGKHTLIAFFTTWCPACQEELPFLELLYVNAKDSTNCNFILISREESPAIIDSVWAEFGYTMPAYCDEDRSVFNAFASRGVPRTYLFSPQGVLLHKTLGFDEENFDELLETFFDALENNNQE